MAEKLSARDRRSKRDALVNCANEFIQELYQNAVDTGVNHKAAVVGFAYSSYNEGKCVNTGLLATPSGRFINYNSIVGFENVLYKGQFVHFFKPPYSACQFLPAAAVNVIHRFLLRDMGQRPVCGFQRIHVPGFAARVFFGAFLLRPPG